MVVSEIAPVGSLADNGVAVRVEGAQVGRIPFGQEDAIGEGSVETAVLSLQLRDYHSTGGINLNASSASISKLFP
jgi:hypothetical protein